MYMINTGKNKCKACIGMAFCGVNAFIFTVQCSLFFSLSKCTMWPNYLSHTFPASVGYLTRIIIRIIMHGKNGRSIPVFSPSRTRLSVSALRRRTDRQVEHHGKSMCIKDVFLWRSVVCIP